MKVKRKVSKIITAVLVGVSVLTLSSVIALGGVVGSLHDLSFDGQKNSYDTVEVCVFCHTPHGANTNVGPLSYIQNSGGEGGNLNTITSIGNSLTGGGGSMLLWNRQLSNATNYVLYTSPTYQAGSGEVRMYSLLCLSCHDGVGALNSLVTKPLDAEEAGGPTLDPMGTTTVTTIGSQAYGAAVINPDIGDRYNYSGGNDNQKVDLSNDHPISIDFTATMTAKYPGEFHSAAGGCASGAKFCYFNSPNDTSLPEGVGIRLFYSPAGGEGTSLECETCHDVHNQGDKTVGTFPFLVTSNNDSALCTACHIK